MRFIKKIGEEEMVLAFLKAEIESPRYKDHIKDFFNRPGYTKNLIDKADLKNPIENQVRLNCLSYRGFRDRQYLFQGFPCNILWERAYIKNSEIGSLKYIRDLGWLKLSSGTRLVSIGAKNIYYSQNNEINTKVRAVQKLIKSGTILPELILASKNRRSELILIEGHVRATAYELTKDYLPDEIEIIAGYSEDLSNWIWY